LSPLIVIMCFTFQLDYVRNVVSDAKLVLSTNRSQTAHFGITKDGNLHFG